MIVLHVIITVSLAFSVLGYYLSQDTHAQIDWPEPDTEDSLDRILAGASATVAVGEQVPTQNLDETAVGEPGSGGLKVIVHVTKETAQTPSGKATLTLTSGDGDRLTKTVTMPAAKGFFVTFEFGPGVVSVGEQVSGLVVTEGFEGQGTVTNTPIKAPEDMYVTLQRQ